uniref:phosphatidylinositol-3,5-bisphosphate 3-phosphatase n=1 Tax=Macrostomum lignano TaxID=282301 RepID=A0A1I8JNB0_9PLAT
MNPMSQTVFDHEELHHLPLPASCHLLESEILLRVGRLANGQIIALTSYRLLILVHRFVSCDSVPESSLDPVFVQPLRCISRLITAGIEFTAIRVEFVLIASPLALQFASAAEALSWARRLDPSAIAALPHLRCSLNSSSPTEDEAADPNELIVAMETRRLGLTEANGWRLSKANDDYSVCSSYSRRHVTPTKLSDAELIASSKYRSRGRFPSIVWRCQGNGAVLARSGQPLVALLGWRCEADEKLLALIGNSGRGRLLIADARTYRSALANRTVGGGFENGSYYSNSEIAFLELPNLHSIRQSFLAMQQRALAPDADFAELADAGGACLLGELEKSRWLQLVSALMGHATRLAAPLPISSGPLLGRLGSDSQLTCLTLLLSDPHYRSLAGFRTLLDREWLQFGHKFASRCGPAEPNEWSPIFVQFLDCLHQLISQFPSEFEFTDLLLRRLATHCYSGLFGQLSCNSDAERSAVAMTTQQRWSLWSLFELQGVRNLFYQPSREVLSPDIGLASLSIWSELYVQGSRMAPDSVRCDLDGLPVEIEPPQAQLLSLINQLETTRIQARQLQDQLNSSQLASTSPVVESPTLAASLQQQPPKSSLPSIEVVDGADARRCFTHWVPDHQRSRCAGCAATFWKAIRRRHHCRACGDVFCHACCCEYVQLPSQLLSGPSRLLLGEHVLVGVPGLLVSPLEAGQGAANRAFYWLGVVHVLAQLHQHRRQVRRDIVGRRFNYGAEAEHPAMPGVHLAELRAAAARLPLPQAGAAQALQVGQQLGSVIGQSEVAAAQQARQRPRGRLAHVQTVVLQQAEHQAANSGGQLFKTVDKLRGATSEVTGSTANVSKAACKSLSSIRSKLEICSSSSIGGSSSQMDSFGWMLRMVNTASLLRCCVSVASGEATELEIALDRLKRAKKQHNIFNCSRRLLRHFHVLQVILLGLSAALVDNANAGRAGACGPGHRRRYRAVLAGNNLAGVAGQRQRHRLQAGCDNQRAASGDPNGCAGQSGGRGPSGASPTALGRPASRGRIARSQREGPPLSAHMDMRMSRDWVSFGTSMSAMMAEAAVNGSLE